MLPKVYDFSQSTENSKQWKWNASDKSRNWPQASLYVLTATSKKKKMSVVKVKILSNLLCQFKDVIGITKNKQTNENDIVFNLSFPFFISNVFLKFSKISYRCFTAYSNV
jgi:hypothetical protein